MKYGPIKQMPYCCVPACISMVLGRRKIPHGTQEEAGYELGLVVPKGVAHLFKKVRAGKKPPAGYGTRVSKERYAINNFFQTHEIPLEENYFPAVEDPKRFIIKNLRKGNDILACFNRKKLLGKGNYGHVCIIEGVSNGFVALIDPQDAKSKRVSLDKLVGAMGYHGTKKRGGFWVISGS